MQSMLNSIISEGFNPEHNPDDVCPDITGAFGSCHIKTYENGNTVLVKTLHKELAGNKPYVDSFHNEYRIGQRLSGHKNIRTYFTCGENDNGAPYIEMELLLGYYGLDTILEMKAPLSLETEDKIISQLLDGVEFIHAPGQGLGEVTHADLKPANIMVNPTKGYSLKIIDFGLAHIAGEELVPGGTPGYAAPEQFPDNNLEMEPVKDILTDIFSIGRILNAINKERYKEIADKASCIDRGGRYQNIGDLRDDYRKLFDNLNSKTGWDTKKWSQEYLLALRTDNLYGKRKLNGTVYEHTLSVIEEGGYDYGQGRVFLKPIIATRKSVVYSKEIMARQPDNRYDTEILVVNDDVLDAAGKLTDNGLKPAVLCACNRQSPKSPGGQEGNMLRRTDLSLFTHKHGISDAYPLDRNWGGVYSSGVTVFRGVEEDGYPLLETPFMVDIISVPAINKPALDRGRLTPGCKSGTGNKIRTIFRIARENGNDSLILSAFGCGNYKNPPEDVAQIFKSVLSEEEFAYSFKKIVFAIKEDRNSFANNGARGGNFGIFKRILTPEPK